MNLAEKENIEIEYWKNSSFENSNSNNVYNLTNKLSEARVLLSLIKKYEPIIVGAHNILEIGAGQGWASCIVKQLFPDKHVIASDISEFAINSSSKWEKILNTKLDQTLSCRSYEIPLENESVDLVFCFQAAHHFVSHRKTLKEIHRVLKPSGVCIYLYEPSCPKFMYKPAHKRVNDKRPHVPEDVLIYKNILKLGRECGLKSEVQFERSYVNRGLIQANYYFIHSKLPFLSRLLPCTANYIFRKEST